MNMVRHLSEKQRIDILIMIGCGDRTRTQTEVCEMFNNKYPDRPISQATVSRVERKFHEVGHVRDIPKAGPNVRIDEGTQLDILLSVEENPHASSRRIANEHNVSKTSVLRVFKTQKMHPYKVIPVHELNEDDGDRRNEFCETIMNLCQVNPQFTDRIIFSDEATFCLNGIVNRQNCRYWSRQNPHWMMEAKTQYPKKLNVWLGIIEDRILGPYFFDGSLTAEVYLRFLETFLVPALKRLYPDDHNPSEIDQNLWFQQDGAPPHFAHQVRTYLNTVFPGRWIGRRGAIEWPARSPDLNPLDYFLWGYLKSKVYIDRPINLEDLKSRIRQEVEQISPQIIQNVLREFRDRLAYCQEVNGLQFEHLL